MLEQQLLVGRTYRFTFKPEFERHGVCSTTGVTCLHKGGGVFTVKQITTYADLIRANDANLYDSFFAPLGISKDDYRSYFNGAPVDQYEPVYTPVPVITAENKAVVSEGKTSIVTVKSVKEKLLETGTSVVTKQRIEELNFSNGPIYKLEDVVAGVEDVLWVPELAIKGIPEVSIEEFRNVSLAVDIGYWDKPEEMDNILTRIREDLMMYGIPPLKVNLVSVDTKWLNRDEYNALTNIRIPGKPAYITTDNRAEMLGKQIVIGGRLKTIVSTKGKDFDPSVQIVIDDIITRKVDISLAKFVKELERTVTLGDGSKAHLDMYFDENVAYLTKTDPDKPIYQTVDAISGDLISTFRLAEEGDTGTKYKDLGPYFEVVKMSDIDESTKYFTKVQLFQEFTGTIDPDVTYYYDDGSRMVPIKGSDIIVNTQVAALETLGEEWTQEEVTSVVNGIITKATSLPDPTKYYADAGKTYDEITTEEAQSGTYVAYKKISEHTFVVDEEGTYVKVPMYHLDYSTDESVKMVGKTFTYTPAEGGVLTTSTVLKPADIAVFANTVARKVKMDSTVAGMYSGLWFEYVGKDAADNDVLKSWIIGSTIPSEVNGKLGTIYGTKGELSQEVYLSDPEIVRERNYYRRYKDAEKALTDMTNQKNLLMERIIQLGG